MTQRRRARRERGRRLHGILLFDKPPGGSSNQVMQRVRRLYDANKAGHTGSLDPLATGMLPICFGEATKLSRFLIDANKGYETTMQLGVTTDSADSDGDVIEQRSVPADLDIAQLQEVCNQFLGEQLQIPPMVSAIKVNGQRLYNLARQGIEVERKPRKVTFRDVTVLAVEGTTARLRVSCSKGTYIRSLVSDIGESIGCGAHVHQLRRTFVAPFEGHSMWTEAQLREHSDPDSLLLPLDIGLKHLPGVTLDEANTALFAQGRAVSVQCRLPGSAPQQNQKQLDVPEMCRVYAPEGHLIGLAVPEDNGMIAPRRVLQW